MRYRNWGMLALGLWLGTPAFGQSCGEASSGKPECAALAVVLQALAAFNAGDTERFRSAWASAGIQIVDDVPPYVWSGDSALQDWMSAAARSMQSQHVADASIKAGKAVRVELGNDSAYIVLPVLVTFKLHGHPVQQRGNQVDVLVRTDDGWRIRAMSYAAPRAKAVRHVRLPERG